MPGAGAAATPSPQVASVLPGRAPTPVPSWPHGPLPASVAPVVPAPAPQPVIAPGESATSVASPAPPSPSAEEDDGAPNNTDQFGPATDVPAETPAPAGPVGAVVVGL